MGLRLVSPGPRLAAVGVLATLTFAVVDWNGAQARSTPAHSSREAHKGATHEGHEAREAHKGGKGGRHGVLRALHGSSYHPPYAAIVVDDNTDQAIYEVNADEPRHPASLTKIMTLYMLFEQLEAGKLKLDSQLPISAHAAGQAPVKLGLKAGQTIAVEDALRAMVTKSANDAACVVAEAIGGGDEAEGARLMTVKARALGMSGTTYVNGSGLPAEEQITTARDQALLGLAIHNRFPNYYTYFSTLSFNWHGREMHNHNGLLGNVRGVDGIKTGYTEASGYNLVASVARDGRHIVSVVLGGTSNGQRDNLMRKLIEDEIPHASVQRTAPPITEAAHPEGPPANPILTVAGTPPVTPVPTFVPAAAATAVPAAAPAAVSAPAATMAVPASAPAVALRGSGDTANPVVPVSTVLPATATFRGSVEPAVTGPKANQARRQKPHVQSAKLQTSVPGQPQAPAAKPATPAAHVVHQGAPAPSSKTAPSATAGAQLRHVPARPSVP
jgi:D-alanyl-D-alanine carboxypeptidase